MSRDWRRGGSWFVEMEPEWVVSMERNTSWAWAREITRREVVAAVVVAVVVEEEEEEVVVGTL